MAKRPITVNADGSATVPLTKGFVAVIDAADVDAVAQHNWYAHPHGRTVYAQTTTYGPKKSFCLHQLLLPGFDGVDHRDGDGLNNRRGNLRPAAQDENNKNARRRRDNTSGFKGVSFHRKCGRWTAIVASKHIGMFDTPEEAARAYNRAAAERFGAFARLNEVPPCS